MNKFKLATSLSASRANTHEGIAVDNIHTRTSNTPDIINNQVYAIGSTTNGSVQ